ncbi:hypothetical protein BU14_2864s0001, partial [Porphyra umbilicalis]
MVFERLLCAAVTRLVGAGAAYLAAPLRPSLLRLRLFGCAPSLAVGPLAVDGSAVAAALAAAASPILVRSAAVESVAVALGVARLTVTVRRLRVVAAVADRAPGTGGEWDAAWAKLVLWDDGVVRCAVRAVTAALLRRWGCLDGGVAGGAPAAPAPPAPWWEALVRWAASRVTVVLDDVHVRLEDGAVGPGDVARAGYGWATGVAIGSVVTAGRPVTAAEGDADGLPGGGLVRLGATVGGLSWYLDPDAHHAAATAPPGGDGGGAGEEGDAAADGPASASGASPLRRRSHRQSASRGVDGAKFGPASLAAARVRGRRQAGAADGGDEDGADALDAAALYAAAATAGHLIVRSLDVRVALVVGSVAARCPIAVAMAVDPAGAVVSMDRRQFGEGIGALIRIPRAKLVRAAAGAAAYMATPDAPRRTDGGGAVRAATP